MATQDRRSDLALLEAWRAGDRRAADELCDRHYDALHRFLHARLPHDAEDLAQRTLLACVEQLEAFRGGASFRSYLFGIARNQLLMALRRERRPSPARVERGSVRSPETAAGAGEERRRIVHALQELPLDYQIALQLAYWEDMTHLEIAHVLDEPPGTVRSRLSRGRVLLAKRLRAWRVRSRGPESTASVVRSWVGRVRGAMVARARAYS